MRQLPIGKGEVLREGKDVTLVGFGSTVQECLRAANILDEAGIDAAVINARFAKPLDVELLADYALRTRGIITAEENVRAGGFGAGVLEALAEEGLGDRVLATLAMPDTIVDHGPQTTMRQVYGLDGPGIAAKVQELIQAPSARPVTPAVASAG